MRKLLTIEAIAPGGEGMARDGERPTFVPFTAPGDEVEAFVPPTEGAGAAHGELLRVLRPGPDRVEPPCRHFGPEEHEEASRSRTERTGGMGEPEAPPSRLDRLCGGCEWLHLAYPAQLAAKARGFFEALRRIGKLEPGSYEAREIVASPDPLRYRSRAKFHWDRASGRLAYFRRRSHEPVRLAECWLLRPGLDDLREAVARALPGSGLDPREVALEWSDHAARGAGLLKLAALSPSVNARAERLLADVPALQGLVLAADRSPSVIVGDPLLAHARRPGDPAAGLQRSRPDVFAQANRGANARLVELAVDLLAPDGLDVLELFCGSGNFTSALAARAARVQAIEEQGPALDLARAAGLPNARFYAGDALRLAQAIARENRDLPAVLLDPPREGAKGIGRVLRDLGASRCVYVSCDPATLARDVRGCVEAGYRLTVAQPVDLFPQTHHVEGVVLLDRA